MGPPPLNLVAGAIQDLEVQMILQLLYGWFKVLSKGMIDEGSRGSTISWG